MSIIIWDNTEEQNCHCCGECKNFPCKKYLARKNVFLAMECSEYSLPEGEWECKAIADACPIQ